MSYQKTILIIEDDLDQQRIYKIALNNAGYATTARKDAMEGLQWLEQILPDLILLDVMLPEISGVEMLQRIRASEHGREVPVVIVTAKGDLVEQDLREFAVSALLRKPILPSHLVETVNRVINASSAE